MKKVVIQSELSIEHQEKIERTVLGSVLIDSQLLHNHILDFQVKLFDHSAHKIIAEAILDLCQKSEPVDLITLTNHLMREHKLQEVGGVAFVSQLTNDIFGLQNFEVHIRLLQEFWLLKYLNACVSETQIDLLEYQRDVFDIYSDLQSKLDNAMKDLVQQQISTISDIHQQLMVKGYEILDGKSDSGGVPTGLTRLDILTNGWQSTDLIILAGRSGMGKTAFSLSILIEPSVNQQIPTAFFSLEMSKEQVVSRLQSIISQINVSKIVKKQLSFDELNHIYNKCMPLKDAPLFIDDSPNISLLELKSKARKLIREKGVRMIIVDYLQLMRSGIKTSSREQEVAEISKGLKALAKELSIPIIALSQLSRNVEQRGGDKKPMLSDLRDSGQIEQDADMVLFCYRPEYYGLQEYNWFGTELYAKNLFMLIVAKHRNGVLGEIPLNFDREFTKISNHPDTFSLYPNDINDSSSVPNNSFLDSIKNPETNRIHSNNVPKNSSFQEHGNSTIRPNNSNFEDQSTGWLFKADSDDEIETVF